MTNLPVDRLSVSSLNTYVQCPERWRRRYILREYEPPSGAIVVGKAAHAAEQQSDATWIESGEPLDTEAVLDHFADEFDLAAEDDEVDWGSEKPGAYKDTGAGALRAYHRDIVPVMAAPERSEREAWLTVDDIELIAYLDVELADGTVVDRKVTKQRFGQDKADRSAQATCYSAIRRAEDGEIPGFDFHAMVRGKSKQYAEVVSTTRTDAQLDWFVQRIYDTAQEIEWRTEADHWAYAPDDAWYCSAKFCGYWAECPGGGAARFAAAEAVRAG